MPAVTIAIVAAIVIGLILLVSVLGSLYQKVGPNQALVVYGRGGTRVVVGGGTVVMPLFQSAQRFSLELLSFDLVPRADLYTQQGIPVKIEAVTQLKVENEDEKIRRAANQFLSKRQEEREGMIRQLMEGHLRGIVGQLTVEQLVKEPEMVSARMRDTVASDLDKLGLEIVSFTIKDVSDDSGYINNLSRPMIAANKQRADIAEAEAARDVTVRRAQTEREAAQAEAEAAQQIAVSRSQAAATEAAAQRDLDLKRAEFKTSTATAEAQAEMAGEIARAEAQRKLVEQTTQTELLRAQRQKDVQAAEADRKQAELVAEVQRPAEAKARAIQVEAEGQAAAIQARSVAQANASRVQGEADASASAARIRQTGAAEAEATRLKGLAEAEALQARVDAQNAQQEASLQTKMLDVLPQIAEKLSAGYAKVGSITYIGTGDDGGLAGKVGRDMIGMVPVVGSLVQSVTGRSLPEIFAGKQSPTPPDAGGNGTAHLASRQPETALPSRYSGVPGDGATPVPVNGASTNQDSSPPPDGNESNKTSL